ncbi:MAG TPA: PD-(D/E)XK nuclease family protein, partial [Candidatus Berkiella sp.]|nr:PD-(D/E)XK nuclease family protein [Candidatus Berkiella sp.]
QALETLIDNQAPPLLPSEKIAATTQLLSLQAACPFKAFAEIRLQARRLEQTEDWLATFEQGIILHEVLQHFWQEVRTQQALLAMTEQALTLKLQQLIDNAIYRYIKPNTPIPYLQVEKNRLLIILHDYLKLEKERKPFKVVAVEWQKEYELLEMTFRLRIDRVDKTELNETILIDYKSGQFQLTQIWGDRPKAPQLPLYYLATIAEQPQALCVAKLNRQTDGYEGISRHSLAIKGIKELTFMPWEELESYWSGTLSTLVASFKKGDAMASPLEGAATCRYCALTSFCRINEQENDDN